MQCKHLFRTRKPSPSSRSNLHRSLTAFDLTLMGIGVIIGAGVFVLTGVAAATKAGPAIIYSYIFSGLGSLFAALSYAELATAVGGCGSAYGYTYAGFGELIAWIIGWNLIFEYTLAVATVAIGWSGYFNDALFSLNIHLSPALTHNPFEGGIVNLPPMIAIGLLAILLCIGTKQSARFTSAIVAIKIAVIALFIFIATRHIFITHVTHWHNFMPFGWAGVMQGAALVFYAYIGFDALSTAAEETINPQRALPLGIIGSVLICAFIYMVVAGLLTLIVPYTALNVKSPVAESLLMIGYPVVAGIIAVGAIAGLTTGMLVMYYGVTRITLAIARDGLLPSFFARIHPRTHTPINNILLYGAIIALIAGFMPLGAAAELVNIGTLSAFILVCVGVIVMRRVHPDLPRPFKLPFGPLIPLLGAAFCAILMYNLPLVTWIRFGLWLAAGLVIYFAWGYRNSRLNANPSEGS